MKRTLTREAAKTFFFCPYNIYTVTSANVYTLAHLGRRKHLGFNINLGKHTLMSYYIFKYNCDFRILLPLPQGSLLLACLKLISIKMLENLLEGILARCKTTFVFHQFSNEALRHKLLYLNFLKFHH